MGWGTARPAAVSQRCCRKAVIVRSAFDKGKRKSGGRRLGVNQRQARNRWSYRCSPSRNSCECTRSARCGLTLVTWTRDKAHADTGCSGRDPLVRLGTGWLGRLGPETTPGLAQPQWGDDPRQSPGLPCPLRFWDRKYWRDWVSDCKY